MKHRGTTPPFRGIRGEILPGSIAEIGYLRLGGVDQWVMIRGENVANPLLIWLHGGPGFPEMRLFRSFNSPLERDFTVVYWEQRGTGKSFDNKIPRSSMTVEQFIADLKAAVAYVKANPAAQGGMAPVYGMAATIPFRGLVSDMLKRYIDLLYKV